MVLPRPRARRGGEALFLPCRFPGARGRRGLSLLELLVVAAILAIVAAGAVRLFSAQGSELKEELALVELTRLRDALRQFREDTGHLPRSGPFGLAVDGPPGQVAIPLQGADWFRSPANVIQLLEQPVAENGQPIMPFDPNTGRGWRGPYLAHGTEGFVSIGSALGPDGMGRPLDGALVVQVPAVADPFDQHLPIGNFLVWANSLGASIGRLGRPILLVDMEEPSQARLISFGPDGVYQAGAGDDLVMPVLR